MMDWIGIIQRYFASAWIIPGDSPRQFYTKRLTDGISSAGVRAKLSTVEPGSSAEVSSVLYSGPQLKKQLLKAAPGMEYTVDYGWLTFYCLPIIFVIIRNTKNCSQLGRINYFTYFSNKNFLLPAISFKL